MNGLPYYPRYPRDFFEGTAGMSFEEKGAYSMVLDLIYMMGERGLPDNPQFISGHLGMSVRKWNSIKARLLNSGKITLDHGIISNFRADKMKIIQSKYRHNQAENARKRWKNNDLAEPPHMPYKKPNTNINNLSSNGDVVRGDPPAPPTDGSRSDRRGDFSADIAALNAKVVEGGERLGRGQRKGEWP